MGEPPRSPLQRLFALNGPPEDLAYDCPERAHSPPLSHLLPAASWRDGRGEEEVTGGAGGGPGAPGFAGQPRSPS